MSAMINLLPDTRQAKQRDKRRRQMMSGAAIVTWVVCGAIILGLSLATAAEKVLIASATKSVQDKRDKLADTPDLIKALTASEHSSALPGLYANRVYMTKFFNALSESDPTDITLSSLEVDSTNLLKVSGGARTYAAVAKLARALEASNVKVGSKAAPTNHPYFTNVEITEAAKSGGQAVAFTIQAQLEPGVTDAN